MVEHEPAQPSVAILSMRSSNSQDFLQGCSRSLACVGRGNRNHRSTGCRPHRRRRRSITLIALPCVRAIWWWRPPPLSKGFSRPRRDHPPFCRRDIAFDQTRREISRPIHASANSRRFEPDQIRRAHSPLRSSLVQTWKEASHDRHFVTARGRHGRLAVVPGGGWKSRSNWTRNWRLSPSASTQWMATWSSGPSNKGRRTCRLVVLGCEGQTCHLSSVLPEPHHKTRPRARRFDEAQRLPWQKIEDIERQLSRSSRRL